MKLEYSKHWRKKKLYRKDITDDFIIYAVQNSSILKDKYWEDALNAICRMPPSGRFIKSCIQKIKQR